MIYTMYFGAMHEGDVISRWHPLYDKYGSVIADRSELVARYIKESENNSFVFITTKTQEKEFNTFLKTNKLNNLIVFETPYYITNPVHIYNGRALKITVLQTEKHFVNDLYDEAEELFNLEEKEVV